jgi:peroxiredoxin
LRWVGWLLALLLGADGCIVAGVATQPAGSAPDFTLQDLSGRDVHLSDYRGKVVLLYFWATYCSPCSTELPKLAALYTRDHERGLAILAVDENEAETAAEVPAYAQRHEVRFPVLLDPGSDVKAEYDPAGALPFGVLIDRDGTVVRQLAGYQPGDERYIDADTDALLSKQ